MDITIRLYGALRHYRIADGEAMHRPFVTEVEQGATVETVLELLGIPPHLISALAVNGEQAETTSALSDGDTVHIFPPAAGG